MSSNDGLKDSAQAKWCSLSEDGSFRLTFIRSQVARGLRGVQFVLDAHEGLRSAIGSALTGTTWQRCRVHACAISSVRCLERHSPWCRRLSGRSLLNRHKKPPNSSWTSWWISFNGSSQKQWMCWSGLRKTCWHTWHFPRSTGSRYARQTRLSV